MTSPTPTPTPPSSGSGAAPGSAGASPSSSLSPLSTPVSTPPPGPLGPDSQTAMQAALVAGAGELLESIRLFDIYRPVHPGGGFGPNEHSMALRLELLDDDANLTDDRIDAAVAAAVQRAHASCGARLRG